MAIELTERGGGKTLEVRVSGKLAHEDYQQFLPEFDRLVKQHGRLRLLFEMVDFHGWEPGAAWDDLKFGVKHHANIERLAMVGDKQWEKGLSAIWRPFTKAEVRYFDKSQAADARTWLERP